MPALPFRSLLFLGADDPERLASAFETEADAVVADLEDFTPADRKDAARRTLSDVFPGARGAARLVRINVPGSEFAAADLDAIGGLELDAIVVPKATPEGIAMLGPEGPPLIAIIESAAGLHSAYEIARSERVGALVLGANDLGADLRLQARPDALELLYARSRVVAESAAAGIRAPFDRVFNRYDDPDGLEADARFARSLGFGGKGCTHVSQPGVVNRVFDGHA